MPWCSWLVVGVLSGAALLVGGCESTPREGGGAPSAPHTASAPSALPSTPRAGTSASRTTFTDVQPPPESVTLHITPMGKGEAAYEVKVHTKDWTISGERQQRSDRHKLEGPTPIPEPERAALRRSVQSIALVTEDETACRERIAREPIACGDSLTVEVNETVYTNDNQSCRSVDWTEDDNPFDTIARAFDASYQRSRER